MTRYLILGNGAAGVTAAEEIRSQDPEGPILIVSGEPYPMYSRPGLAYLLLNEVSDQQIIARTPDWYVSLQIQLIYSQVVELQPDNRLVLLANGRRLTYDKLLIATGARAVTLPYRGAELEGVVYLDTLDGTKDLLRRVKSARRAVVIGGGITALELAEGLAHHKLETHYLVRRSSLWSTVFNEAESKTLEERMRSHHVHIHFNTEIDEILGNKKGRVSGVRLHNGSVMPCELVGAGVGVKPEIEFLRDSPIQMDRAILVNEFLETNVTNIFAAGDCAQVWDPWTGRHTQDVLWPTAVASGRQAGANMAGRRQPYLRSTPFNACLLFGLHITAIGQLGSLRDDSEPEIFQHLSRGSSEVWSTRPHGYRSAWANSGLSSVRFCISDDVLVGALVMGQQTLADPLRTLIESQVNISSLRPYLEQGGPALVQALLKLWSAYKRDQPALS